MTRLATAVLAGERGGPDPVADAEGVSLKVLIPLGGRPLLERVLATTEAVAAPVGRWVCGPAEDQLAAAPWLRARLEAASLHWIPPAPSPAASVDAVLRAAAAAGAEAVAVTTGDHPLLTEATFVRFVEAALATGADAVAGLADHARVRAAFPDSRRTALRFADGARCGCNLFLFRPERSGAVLDFWRRVERERKQPHRLLAALGPVFVMRYLAGRLTLTDALTRLGEITGARVATVAVPDPDAAVDVDTPADLATVRARLDQRARGIQ